MIDSIGAKLNPISGILSIPLSGLGYRQNLRMRPREILAANLRALMAEKPGLDTIKKIVTATNGRLSNGKLDRVRRGIAATDLDTLEELAALFEVAPWHLLVENLKPSALPILGNVELLAQIKDLMRQTDKNLSQIAKTEESKGIHQNGEPGTSRRISPRPSQTKQLGPGLRDALVIGQGSENARGESMRVPKQRRNKRS